MIDDRKLYYDRGMNYDTYGRVIDDRYQRYGDEYQKNNYIYLYVRDMCWRRAQEIDASMVSDARWKGC